jgi:hypothetical protein
MRIRSSQHHTTDRLEDGAHGESAVQPDPDNISAARPYRGFGLERLVANSARQEGITRLCRATQIEDARRVCQGVACRAPYQYLCALDGLPAGLIKDSSCNAPVGGSALSWRRPSFLELKRRPDGRRTAESKKHDVPARCEEHEYQSLS